MESKTFRQGKSCGQEAVFRLRRYFLKELPIHGKVVRLVSAVFQTVAADVANPQSIRVVGENIVVVVVVYGLERFAAIISDQAGVGAFLHCDNVVVTVKKGLNPLNFSIEFILFQGPFCADILGVVKTKQKVIVIMGVQVDGVLLSR